MTEIPELEADVRKPCPEDSSPDNEIGTEDEPSKASQFVGDTASEFENPQCQMTPEAGENDAMVDEEISAYLPTTQVQKSPNLSALDAKNSSFNQYQKFFDTSATADESVTNGDDALKVCFL